MAATLGEAVYETTFAIDRADNEIEIADTVGTVQPTVVKNPAKAALTYTYYADEACTKEIAAPTVAGTYYVVATSDATANYNAGKSNVAKVTILGTAKNLKATAVKSTAIKVSYDAVAGADGYRVYVKNAKTGNKYKAFAQGNKTACTASGLAMGTTNKIAVRAFNKVDGKVVLAPKYTEITVKTAPTKTSKVAVTTTKNAAKITWNKVAGANGYRVYVKTSKGWKQIAQGNKLTYTYKNLKGKTTYTFAVRAFVKNGSTINLADKYVTKSAKTK
jgi:hypothetical protein